MKIKKQHFDKLKNEIDIILSNWPTLQPEQYENGHFPRSDRVKDLQRRYCFDLFHAVIQKNPCFLSELYEYMNDDHIYTALKKCCPAVSRRY